MLQSSRPSIVLYPLPSHPPINPPRQPCYHDDRASAKLKSRTWLPWFPLLRLQPRPRAGWEGAHRCSVSACAMRPLKGAGETGGGASSTEGGKRKGSDREWNRLLRWPKRDAPGRRLQDGRLCGEGGDGDPRGVGCTCRGPEGGLPLVGAALSSIWSAKDPLPGSCWGELTWEAGNGTRDRGGEEFPWLGDRGLELKGGGTVPSQRSAWDSGFGSRNPRSLPQRSHGRREVPGSLGMIAGRRIPSS